MKIIQIGANRGNDHVTKLVKSFDVNDIELLLLVEPISMVIPQLKECYAFLGDKAVVEQIAIVENNNQDTVEIFYTPIMEPADAVPTYELSSIKREHVLTPGVTESDIYSYSIPCMTISSLFDKYNIIDLDYLFVDAEGIDGEIIKSIDLEKYNIKNVQVEYIHSSFNLSGHFGNYGYSERGSLDIYGFDKLFYK